MIKNINIQNFKSIKEATVELSNLNLFTGVNASGKSTFLQTLLLLRQSYLTGYLTRRNKVLFLGNRDKETLTNLGTFKDVLYENAEKNDNLVIGFEDSEQLNLNFSCVTADSDNKGETTIAGNLKMNTQDLDAIPLFSDNFQYLAADRIAPQEYYPRFEGNELLGKDGAFTAHFLEKYGNKPITIKGLKHERTQGDIDTLIGQVNYWMQDISPNINIQTKENLTTNNIELSYRYIGENGLYTPQDRKPQNVGYGITTTLPILVAILAAKPGDIIIIENPETHIHPKGQTRLAMLISKAAEAGVQFLIESHSDHILNGIRVATKKKMIDAEKVRINFFTRSNNQTTTIERLHLDNNGRIDAWPKGFFDEWDNMLDELL
jgi:predicted ATPase